MYELAEGEWVMFYRAAAQASELHLPNLSVCSFSVLCQGVVSNLRAQAAQGVLRSSTGT